MQLSTLLFSFLAILVGLVYVAGCPPGQKECQSKGAPHLPKFGPKTGIIRPPELGPKPTDIHDSPQIKSSSSSYKKNKKSKKSKQSRSEVNDDGKYSISENSNQQSSNFNQQSEHQQQFVLSENKNGKPDSNDIDQIQYSAPANSDKLSASEKIQSETTSLNIDDQSGRPQVDDVTEQSYLSNQSSNSNQQSKQELLLSENENGKPDLNDLDQIQYSASTSSDKLSASENTQSEISSLSIDDQSGRPQVDDVTEQSYSTSSDKLSASENTQSEISSLNIDDQSGIPQVDDVTEQSYSTSSDKLSASENTQSEISSLNIDDQFGRPQVDDVTEQSYLSNQSSSSNQQSEQELLLSENENGKPDLNDIDQIQYSASTSSDKLSASEKTQSEISSLNIDDQSGIPQTEFSKKQGRSKKRSSSKKSKQDQLLLSENVIDSKPDLGTITSAPDTSANGSSDSIVEQFTVGDTSPDQPDILQTDSSGTTEQPNSNKEAEATEQILLSDNSAPNVEFPEQDFTVPTLSDSSPTSDKPNYDTPELEIHSDSGTPDNQYPSSSILTPENTHPSESGDHGRPRHPSPCGNNKPSPLPFGPGPFKPKPEGPLPHGLKPCGKKPFPRKPGHKGSEENSNESGDHGRPRHPSPCGNNKPSPLPFGPGSIKPRPEEPLPCGHHGKPLHPSQCGNNKPSPLPLGPGPFKPRPEEPLPLGPGPFKPRPEEPLPCGHHGKPLHPSQCGNNKPSPFPFGPGPIKLKPLPKPGDEDDRPTYSLLSSSNHSRKSSANSFLSILKHYAPPENQYFEEDTCKAVDISVRKYIPKSVLQELEVKYLQTKCSFLQKFSSFPDNIAPHISDYSDERLTFDVVLIGSGPGTLSAIKPLLDLGKSLLLIENGRYPPFSATSIYHRPNLLLSDYASRLPATAPGCDAPKYVFVSNILGGISSLNNNQWVKGSQSNYVKWARISEKWSWGKISKYYDAIENAHKATVVAPKQRTLEAHVTEVTETNTEKSDYEETHSKKTMATGGENGQYSTEECSSISISKTVTQTKVTREVHTAFTEIGVGDDQIDVADIKRKTGFTLIPLMSDGEDNVLYSHKVLEAVGGNKNIKLAMNTEATRIIFSEQGRATGVEIQTLSGEKRIVRIRDELILGTGSISSVKLLTQSGVGKRETLQKIGIPLRIESPSLGENFVTNPTFLGTCITFPQGSLIEDWNTDFAAMEYMYGRTKMSLGSSISFYKAYMKINTESEEANVRVNFYSFSKSTINRLRSYLRGLFQLSSRLEEQLVSLCDKYDLLILAPQIMEVESKGSISVRRKISSSSSVQVETVIDTGMYSNSWDMEIMRKAVEKIETIAQTQSFRNLNANLVPLQLDECEDGDTECLIRYLSIPNLLPTGGLGMGTDWKTSVVDDELRIHRTENVRCFSSAVIPFSIASESAACPIMIGSYGSDMIAQKYRTSRG